MLKLLLLSFVLFSAGTAYYKTPKRNLRNSEILNNEKINSKLPDVVDVEKYTIQIAVYLDEDRSKNFSFDGVVDIDFKLKDHVDCVTLHYENLTVTSEELFQNNSKIEPLEKAYDAKTNFFKVFKPEHRLSPGNYSLKLHYNGALSELPKYDDPQGFYKIFYVNEKNETKWLASTSLEPVFARRVFPCFDEPKHRAIFNVSINHHKNYSAIFNTEEKFKSQPDPNGRVVTSFKLTPKLPTHAFAVALSDFSKTTNDKNNHSLYSRPSELPPGNSSVLEIEAEIMKKLEDFTGLPLQLKKFDWFSTPIKLSYSRESWGLVTISENYLSPTKTHEKNKMDQVGKIINGVTRQWFGNLVSHDEWKSLWVNEALAGYIEPKILAQMSSNHFDHIEQILAFWLTQFRSKIADIYRPKEDIASCIFTMMEHILTRSIFIKGLKTYLISNMYSTANLESLYKAMEVAMRAEKYELPYDLKSIMDSWMNREDYPILNVTRNYENKSMLVEQVSYLSLTESKLEKNEPINWYVPINVATNNNPDFNKTTPDLWLKGSSLNVSIEANAEDWIVLNKQQTGFYRVNYDEKNWKLITDFLKTSDREKIHPVNRAQFMMDALEFYKLGTAKLQTLLDLVDTLANETDVNVVTRGLGITEMLYNKLINTKYEVPYLKIVKKMILPTLQRIGLENSNEDDFITTDSRTLILYQACTVNDESTITSVQKKLDCWLKGPYDSSKLDEYVLLYCGFKNADFGLWKKVYDKALNETDQQKAFDVIEGLASTTKKEHLTIILSDLLDDDTKRFPKDLIIRRILTASSAGVDVVLDFMLDKIDDFGKMFNEEYILETLGSIITNEKQLGKLEQVVGKVNIKASVVETAKKNVKWLEDHESQIKNWLNL